MSRAAKIFRMGMFPGIVAIVLAFGASQALAAPQDGPPGSSPAARYCYDGPMTADCPGGYWCCDKTGCTCGG